MLEKAIEFYSEGCKLQGTVYLPEGTRAGAALPAIIPCSGYNGFNIFYPRLFAMNLVKAGYVCFGFDYRGFANSEGEKGRVLLQEQVEDIKNALTFLQTQPEVDASRIGLIGWGMGASNVVRVTAEDQRVQAVAALNGFYNGERWLRSIHSYVDWHKIKREVEEDRIRRVTTGKSLLAESFHHYPLDAVTEKTVQVELAKIPGFGEQVSLQFTESIMNLNCDKVVADIAPRPLFIAHGKRNLLHPIEESLALFEAAREPKTFYAIEGEHNDFMYGDHPVFQELVQHVLTFFEVSLTYKRVAAADPFALVKKAGG